MSDQYPMLPEGEMPPRTQRERLESLGNGGGQYPHNWPQIAEAVKAETTILTANGIPAHLVGVRTCVRCRHAHDPDTGFMLTVHHLDLNKSNCEPWNLAALCQRCHLRIQGKVDFLQPYAGEHSQWMEAFVWARSILSNPNKVGSFESWQPLGENWTQWMRAISRKAILDRPPCICPGWIYQQPEGPRFPDCPAHGQMAAIRAASAYEWGWQD